LDGNAETDMGSDDIDWYAERQSLVGVVRFLRLRN